MGTSQPSKVETVRILMFDLHVMMLMIMMVTTMISSKVKVNGPAQLALSKDKG